MGYYIELLKDGNTAKVENHSEGGTFAIGGREEAAISVTYNYSPFYRKHLDKEKGLRWLYVKTGAATVERLEKAIEALGVETSDNYWEPTPGNAGHALSVLLRWAKEHPDAVWEGD